MTEYTWCVGGHWNIVQVWERTKLGVDNRNIAKALLIHTPSHAKAQKVKASGVLNV